MLYTIGHSTLDQLPFLELLESVQIRTLIDVRSHPTSKWPQFRKSELENWIPTSGVQYEWWPGLGGWDRRHLPLAPMMATYGVDVEAYARGKFPKQRIAATRAETDKPSWTSQGLFDYQYFMILPEFLDKAEQLISLGQTTNVGFFCSEVLPWKCHRSMIADYLIWKGVDCIHLQPKPKNHSTMLGNRLERYEPDVLGVWGGRAQKVNV